MSKYQVFEISKNGKRIIESDLSIAKAEEVSQEMVKNNLENVYGYEPVYKGVKVGESYNFLFEGKNNDYDEEYKDYIEEGEMKMDRLNKWQKKWAIAGSNPMNERIFNEMINEFASLILSIEHYQDRTMQLFEENEELKRTALKTRQIATEEIEKLEKEKQVLETMLESSRGTTHSWVKQYSELEEKVNYLKQQCGIYANEMRDLYDQNQDLHKALEIYVEKDISEPKPIWNELEENVDDRKLVKVVVNGKEFDLFPSDISYASAVALAGFIEGTQYTVTYSAIRGKSDVGGSILPKQLVNIVDGMIINVSDTSKA